jgi:hypothetical protein
MYTQRRTSLQEAEIGIARNQVTTWLARVLPPIPANQLTARQNMLLQRVLNLLSRRSGGQIQS